MAALDPLRSLPFGLHTQPNTTGIMTPDPKHAAYLRLALQLGVRSVSDIVQWADSQISALDDPTDSLIDLSLMAKSHPIDVMGKLGGLSGEVTPLDVAHEVLADAHAALLDDPSFGRPLAKCLYHFCVENDYPRDFIQCVGFDDDYALADQGLFTVEDAYNGLLEYTETFVGRENGGDQ